MANDTAAIHVLKKQCSLSDDDYRALLRQLTGLSSCKGMPARQLAGVRSHLEGLAARLGVAKPQPARRLSREAFERVKKDAAPKERKAWALWHQLHRDGRIDDASPRSLNAWVHRQTGVSALQFCNGAQLDTVIESLKCWDERSGT